jgi:hypothetical protein
LVKFNIHITHMVLQKLGIHAHVSHTLIYTMKRWKFYQIFPVSFPENTAMIAWLKVISGFTKMKENMNIALVRVGIIFLILMFVSSAGCIRHFQNNNSGETEGFSLSVGSAIETQSLSGDIPHSNPPSISSSVAITTPPEYIEVADVDPNLYVTPDPYRLPYRDHGNWTAIDSSRVPKIPQFTKSFTLRSNSSAIRVNVTQGPLIIDLTFSPFFENPDQTGDTSKSYPSDDEEESDDESDEGPSRVLSGTFAFVYPYAEISVIDAITNETVAKEGYGGIYSSGTKNSITIYREGSFIVTLTGDFVKTDMKITTGSAAIKTTVPTPTPIIEEEWE